MTTMSNFRVCIYFKTKEKPVIITDSINKDFTYEDSVNFFKDVLKGENKVVTIDFPNDTLVFNCKDVDVVKISKPELGDTIVADDEHDSIVPASPNLNIKSEDPDEEADDGFDDEEKTIDVVED